jgi:multidrug resistance efflux pump
MTNKIRNFSSLAILGVLLSPAGMVLAQSAPDSATTTTSTTSTTTSAGTISQFSPDSIVVKTTTSADPISYSYTKTTTYVDQNGNPVSVETVKSGMPVTVYYTQDGDKMVASKVVVQSTSASSDGSAPSTVETKKTTTTTPAP